MGVHSVLSCGQSVLCHRRVSVLPWGGKRAFLAGFPRGPAWEEGERCDQDHLQACVSKHKAEPLFTRLGVGKSEVGGASSASQSQQGSVASPGQGIPPSSC